MDGTVERIVSKIREHVEAGSLETAEKLARGLLPGAIAQAGATQELKGEVAAALDDLGVPHSYR